MIFNFAGGPVGTKVPLLPHDFMEGLTITVRPPQRVFLRCSIRFHEIEPNPCQLLRRPKVKPDRLWARPACAPSRTWLGQQGQYTRASDVTSTSASPSTCSQSSSARAPCCGCPGTTRLRIVDPYLSGGGFSQRHTIHIVILWASGSVLVPTEGFPIVFGLYGFCRSLSNLYFSRDHFLSSDHPLRGPHHILCRPRFLKAETR